MARLLLSSLDLLEAELHWQHEQFTEIRVTVEQADTRQAVPWFSLRPRRHGVSYRTAPLVKTLRRETNAVVSLQGPPGSGKSVALRQFARFLLWKAVRAGSSNYPLALYVSLRDLNVAADAVTTPALLNFIRTQVNLRESPDLTDYLDNQLERDIRDGKVVILLDSFDEIPAVMGSVNIDKAVLPYVEAISGLVGGGPSQCVIASREYKGPRVPGWIRIQLVGMSTKEQFTLLRTYGMPRRFEAAIDELLRDPRIGFSTDLRNPLYLGLLCRYVRATNRIPSRPSELFEGYIAQQLDDSADVDREGLLETLQAFSFELTNRAETGLASDVRDLRRHAAETFPDLGDEEVEQVCDQMIASRLLVEVPARAGAPRRVAFAHRRVQEYLATRYVLSHRAQIEPQELIEHGRWRETAVTIVQVASDVDKAPLLEALQTAVARELAAVAENGIEFAWSAAAIHLLDLLGAAYASDPRPIPAELRELVTQLVVTAWERGKIDDRKYALDCIPLIEPERQQSLATAAFSGNSAWLRLSALRDCSALHPLPDALADAIRRLLVTLMGSPELRRNTQGLNSSLSRLYQGQDFLRARRLLAVAPFVVFVIAVVHVAIAFTAGGLSLRDIYALRIESIYWILLPMVSFWTFQATVPLSFPVYETRFRRLVKAVSAFLARTRRQSALQTNGVWNTTLFFAAVYVLENLIIGVVELAIGRDRNVPAALVYYPLSGFYGLLWGPAFILMIRKGAIKKGSVKAFVIPPFSVVRDTYKNRESSVVGVAVGLLFAIIVQVAFIAAFGFALYAIGHYLGRVGKDSANALIVFFFVTPFVVLAIEAYQFVNGRRRLRRQVRRQLATLTPESFVDGLAKLSDPMDAAEYVRELRTRYRAHTDLLPLQFIHEFMKALEAGLPEPVPPRLTPVAHLLKETPARRREGAWRTAVLDELGMLADLLRER